AGAQPLVTRAPARQSSLLMVAADIDEVDLVALHAGDDRREVLVALVVGLEHLFGNASLVEGLLGFVSKAFAVRGLVVQDRDVLALVVLGDVLAGDSTLLVVAAANAGDIPELALGEQRVGGSRRNLQHVTFGIGFRRRDRRRGAIVSGHERNFRAGEFFGDGTRLFGIAGVIAHLQGKLLAENAAGGIDVVHRLFGAVLHLPAECGFATGHRT